ncbi:hypothetical protein HAN_1g14 (nucleomorph) [Hemiselmis andersenii]|uniref:Uncharacterized protein n=1 Tax=Hemiselmis andersenii TaxID=464988 RepID=A9BK29_HEMAN|nr:hypothetical protein HAN_1g14 [Hemiselmis andersenii]ABW97862.1 hypothetical protein HAN_1g14 [Hemiselmis andersenii]
MKKEPLTFFKISFLNKKNQKKRIFFKDWEIIFKFFKNTSFYKKKFKKIYLIINQKLIKFPKILPPPNISIFLKSLDFKNQKNNKGLNFFWKFWKSIFFGLKGKNVFFLENLIFRKIFIQKKYFWVQNQKIFSIMLKKISKINDFKVLCFLISNFKFVNLLEELEIFSRKKNFYKFFISLKNFNQKKKKDFSIKLFFKKKILETEGDLSFSIFLKSFLKINKKKISKKESDWFFYFTQHCSKENFRLEDFSKTLKLPSFFYEFNIKNFFPSFLGGKFFFYFFDFFSKRTKKRFLKYCLFILPFLNFLDRNFSIKKLGNNKYTDIYSILFENLSCSNKFFSFFSLEKNNDKKNLFLFLLFFLKQKNKVSTILKRCILFQMEIRRILKKKKFKIVCGNLKNLKLRERFYHELLNSVLLGGVKSKLISFGLFFENFLKKIFKIFNSKNQNIFIHNFLSAVNWSYIVFYTKKNFFTKKISIPTFKLEIKKNYLSLKGCNFFKKIHNKIEQERKKLKNLPIFKFFSPKIKKKKFNYICDGKEIFLTIENLQFYLLSEIKKKNIQKVVWLSFFKKIWNQERKKKTILFLKNFFFEKNLREISNWFSKKKFNKKIAVKLLGSCFSCLRKFLKKISKKTTGNSSIRLKKLPFYLQKKFFSKQFQKKILIDFFNIYFKFFLKEKNLSLGKKFSIFEFFFYFYQHKTMLKLLDFFKTHHFLTKKNNFPKLLFDCFFLKFFKNCTEQKEKKKIFNYYNKFQKIIFEICIPFDPFVEIISHNFKKIFSNMGSIKDLKIMEKLSKTKRLFNSSFRFFRKNYYSSLIEKVSLGQINTTITKFGKKKPLNISFFLYFLKDKKTLKKNKFLIISKVNDLLYFPIKVYPFLKINLKNCFFKRKELVSYFLKTFIFNFSFKLIFVFYKESPLFVMENHFLGKFFSIWLKITSKKNPKAIFFFTKRTKNFFFSFNWFSNKNGPKTLKKKRNAFHKTFLKDILNKNYKGDINLLSLINFFKILKNQKIKILVFLKNILKEKNFLSPERKNIFTRNSFVKQKIFKVFKKFLKKFTIFAPKNFFFGGKLITEFLSRKIKKKFLFPKNLLFWGLKLKKKTIFLCLISKILDSGLLFGKIFKILSIKIFQLFLGTKINELEIQKKKKLFQSFFLFFSVSYSNYFNFFFLFFNIFSKRIKKTREKIFWLFAITISRRNFFLDKKRKHFLDLSYKIFFSKQNIFFKPFFIYLINEDIKIIPKRSSKKTLYSYQKIFFFFSNLILFKKNFPFFQKFLKVFFDRWLPFQKNKKNIYLKILFTLGRKLKKNHFLIYQKKYFKILSFGFENLILLDCFVKIMNFNFWLSFFKKKKIFEKIRKNFHLVWKNLKYKHFKNFFQFFLYLLTIMEVSGNPAFLHQFILSFKKFHLFFLKILKMEFLKRLNSENLSHLFEKFLEVSEKKLKIYVLIMIKKNQIFKQKYDSDLFFFRKTLILFFKFLKKNKKPVFFSLFIKNFFFFGPSTISSEILKISTIFFRTEQNFPIRTIFFYINFWISEIFFYFRNFSKRCQKFFSKKIKQTLFYLKKIKNFSFWQNKISRPLNNILTILFQIPGSNLKIQILKSTKDLLEKKINPGLFLNFMYYLIFLFSKIKNSLYLFKIDELIGKFFFSIKSNKIKFRIISIFFLRLLRGESVIKKERFYGIFLKLISFFFFFFQNFNFNHFFLQIFMKFLKKNYFISINFDGFLCKLLIFSFSIKNYRLVFNFLKKNFEIQKNFFVEKIRFSFFSFSFFFVQKLDKIKLNIFLTMIKDIIKKNDNFGTFFPIFVNFLLIECNWSFLIFNLFLRKFFSKKISLCSKFSQKIFLNFLTKILIKIGLGNLNFLNEHLIPVHLLPKLKKILLKGKNIFFFHKKNEILTYLITINTIYSSFFFWERKKNKKIKNYYKTRRKILKKKKTFLEKRSFFSKLFILIKIILKYHFFVNGNFFYFFEKPYFRNQNGIKKKNLLIKFPYIKLRKIFFEILKN